MLFEDIVKNVIHTKYLVCSLVDIKFTNHTNCGQDSDKQCRKYDQLPTPTEFG